MHEKPSMELREFFVKLDFETYQRFLKSWQVAGNQTEFDATIAEARQFCPLVAAFESQLLVHQAAGEEESVKRDATQIMMLATIYRVAEDMGYEW